MYGVPKSAGKSRVFDALYDFFTIFIQGERQRFTNIFTYSIEGGNMNQNQNELREKLNVTIASGLVAKAIADKTGITQDILSRFKNGHICLCDSDSNKLSAYLDKIVIP